MREYSAQATLKTFEIKNMNDESAVTKYDVTEHL